MKLGLVREFFAAQIGQVDEALGALLRERNDPAEHYGMIRYHFGFSEGGQRLPSGKRMRAIFCLLIGGATGAPPAALRTLMVATELMHGASLAHDDVEDGDLTRWDRSTLWSRFGANQAVNAGDAMIGLTYGRLLRLAGDGVPPATVLRVIEIYAQAHLRMAEGQHLDLACESRPDTTIATYLDIIARKTASACECPSRAAAVLAAKGGELEEACAAFGRSFGMLYQMVDDVAGVWGDPDSTGKAELADVALHKASLPVIVGLARGSPRLRALFAGPRACAPSARLTREQALGIRDELTGLRVREECCTYMAKYRDEAIASLKATRSDGPEIGLLEMMTRLCAEMGGLAEGLAGG